MRLDLFLLHKNLASSRTHAQELIRAGQVFMVTAGVKKRLSKPSLLIESEDANIIVELGPANRFVSRGGLKLEGALDHLKLQVAGWIALDVGISTGGFTDCLLQKGAARVVGVDVGHGQLHPALKSDPRLQLIEGVNARELDVHADLAAVAPPFSFDLIVMDVSFISITLIIPKLPPLLKSGGTLLSLVKPQFEVGVEGIGRGGVVKDPGLYSGVEDTVTHICASSGLNLKAYFESTIEGKDGNREFFVCAQKP
jgi:23S rRNA (cytidine1920-2'-O)/16S rRNA (cytidine1409-2'-O)-methyltransferase